MSLKIGPQIKSNQISGLGGGAEVRTSGGIGRCCAGSLHSVGSQRGSTPLGSSAIAARPPTNLNLTLLHMKLSPRDSLASSNVACCWSFYLALLAEPAYHLAYADWERLTQSQVRHASCSPGSIMLLAFELNQLWNFADFSSPQSDLGFEIGQDKPHPLG